MRHFDSELQAIAWLNMIAEESSDKVFNIRVGYHDVEESIKTYDKKKNKSLKSFPFRIDLEVVIANQLASIGCDLGQLHPQDK